MWHAPSKCDVIEGSKCRIYDAGEDKYPFDNITVVLYGKEWGMPIGTKKHQCLCIGNGNAGCFGECISGLHLGKRVTFESLSPKMKQAIKQRLNKEAL